MGIIRIRMIIFGYIFSFIVIILDQLSKLLIMNFLEGGQYSLGKYLNLVYVFNTGISFSLFSNNASWTPIIFSLVGCVFVLILIFWLRKAQSKFHALGLGSIIGGALGNIIDRLVHGAVFDFIDFHFHDYHFPAFNLADSAIFIGVILVIFDNIFFQGNKKNAPE